MPGQLERPFEVPKQTIFDDTISLMLEIINDDSKTVGEGSKNKSEEKGKVKHFAMSSFTKLDDNSTGRQSSNSRKDKNQPKSNFLEVNSPRDDPEYVK